MTIEVPAGLRSWLCLIDLSFGFFLSRVLSSLAFFTFLILSLDLGVTCAFLDTNGLCDDSMRSFLSFLPYDSGLFIVFPLRFFMGGKQVGSTFASAHLFSNTLYPASIIMRGSNFLLSTLPLCLLVSCFP